MDRGAVVVVQLVERDADARRTMRRRITMPPNLAARVERVLEAGQRELEIDEAALRERAIRRDEDTAFGDVARQAREEMRIAREMQLDLERDALRRAMLVFDFDLEAEGERRDGRRLHHSAF